MPASMANPHQTQTDLAAALLGLRIGDADGAENDAASDTFDRRGIAQSTLDTSHRIIGSNCDYHELHFEVPAISLLPKDKTLYLPDPANMQFRRRPRADTLTLSQNNDDFSFCVRLETFDIREVSPLPYLDAILDHDAEALAECVHRLSCTPGISTLELVAWFEHETIRYRARVTTHWISAGGEETTESAYFSFGHDQWEDLHEQIDEGDWLDVLRGLFQRSSDRAYLHVREILHAHDPWLAAIDEEMLADQWNIGEVLSANQLLVSRIRWLDGNSYEARAVLPCGHTLEISAFHLLHSIPDHKAVDFVCGVCTKYVLSEEDYSMALMFRDKCWRTKSDLDERCWAALCAKLDGRSGNLAVSNAELFSAIDSVATSLLYPESVFPAALCPGATHETARLMVHFDTLLRINNNTFSLRIGTAAQDLVEMALQKLRNDAGVGYTEDIGGVLPPGYVKFLEKWFTRAIASLATRADREQEEMVDELMSMMLSGSGGERGASRHRD